MTECAVEDTAEFYKLYFRPKVPCIMRKAFEIPASWFSDEDLKEIDWRPVVVEQQNRVIHSHRKPFWLAWSFRRFVNAYRHNPYYLINPNVPAALLPEVPLHLRCTRLARALKHRRLWFSGGNTTSSLHFDTHDNFVQQITGTKEVFIWHPNEARNVYMDSDIRYGLSPINVDTVDLKRFSAFARASPPLYAALEPGDQLYIPWGFWHQLRAPIGRNAMITNEFEARVPTPPSDHDLTSSQAFLRAFKININNQAMRC